jgi:nitroimidazol reductase NimA-like FMN-containing flavoprotein (pyridoxamine 5'-phosphate oxidase superfamily)
MIKELSRKAAEELLREQKIAHLGCVLPNGEPYVVPVNYLYMDKHIYIHTLPGRKLDALRKDSQICVQVERIKGSCRWESVIAFGECYEVKKINDKIKILQEFSKRFEQLTPVEAMIEEKWNSGGVIVLGVNIKKITGIAEK